MHGRPLDLIRPHLQPGARPGAEPRTRRGRRRLPAACRNGFGQSTAYGSRSARRRKRACLPATSLPASRWRNSTLCNVCALEVVGRCDARVLTLPAAWTIGFSKHDGQITKREVRALTLSALAPPQGRTPSGTSAPAQARSRSNGCLPIRRCAPSHRGVVRTAARIAAIRPLGVPGLVGRRRQAPEALRGLPQPDAIFIGGGGSSPG